MKIVEIYDQDGVRYVKGRPCDPPCWLVMVWADPQIPRGATLVIRGRKAKALPDRFGHATVLKFLGKKCPTVEVGDDLEVAP